MPSHKNQYYERLLDILVQAQTDIQTVLGPMDAKNLKSVSDILGMRDETQRVGHALWNLTCIFYRIANVYGPNDNPGSWRKVAEFGKVLAQSINPLCASILLLDSTIQGKEQKDLFNHLNKQDRTKYKQQMHITNVALFKLGVIVVRVLNEINPDYYDSFPTDDPKTIDLYGKMTEFWRTTLTQLPDTITENLCSYFNGQALEQQRALAEGIPNTRFTQTLYEKIHSSFSSSNQKSKLKRKPKNVTIIEEEDLDSGEDIITDPDLVWEGSNPATLSPEVSIHKPAPFIPLDNWRALQAKYFKEEQYQGKFYACLQHYTYSFYTVFEIFMAYFWFTGSYNYGETRQQRRHNLTVELKELMIIVAADIQTLSDTKDDKQAENKFLTDLIALKNKIKHHFNLFGSMLGDGMTDCLVDLDRDIYLFCQDNIVQRVPQHIKTLRHSGSPLHQTKDSRERAESKVSFTP